MHIRTFCSSVWASLMWYLQQLKKTITWIFTEMTWMWGRQLLRLQQSTQQPTFVEQNNPWIHTGLGEDDKWRGHLRTRNQWSYLFLNTEEPTRDWGRNDLKMVVRTETRTTLRPKLLSDLKWFIFTNITLCYILIFKFELNY